MKQDIMVRLAVIALALFLAVAFAQSAFAQWSNDPSIGAPICTYGASVGGLETKLTAISDGAGGIFAAWHGSGNVFRMVITQRLGLDGRMLWPAEGFTVAQSPGAWGRVLHMASDHAGGMIILIEGKAYGFTQNVIQRINGLGIPLWASAGIFLYECNGLVSDGAGGAILVGVGGPDPRSWVFEDVGLYAYRFDASANLVWSRQLISMVNQGGRPNPKIVSDGNGGAVIAWMDYRAGGYGEADIYAQRISPAGVVQWVTTGVPIVVVPGDQSEVALTPDGTGGAFIAWIDSRVSDKNVYAQRINGAGIVQWTANGINVSSANNANMNCRSIVSDGSGGVVVAWSQWKSCGGMVGCAQRLSGSGTLLWPVGGIDLTGCEAEAVEVISDGVGGFVAVWDQWNVNKLFYDIYAQRFSAGGTRLWASNGVPVSTYPINNRHATPVLDGRGGVIVPLTLENMYGVASALYAQRINLDGTLGAPALIANGGFEQGLTSWSGGGCVTTSIVAAGCGSTSAAKVLITGQNCSAQFYQHGFAIENGKRYRVKFQAWSSRGEDMDLAVLPHSAWTPNIGLGLRVNLGTTPCTNYQYDFRATATTTDARLRFMFNYLSTTGYWYMFDNVSIERLLPKEGEIEELSVPTAYALDQNYPNPFNPTTNISFALPNDGMVTLKVFDVLGREVKSLVNEVRVAGSYSEIFDAANLASGMYFYKLESGNFVQTKKMLVLQ